MDVWVPPIRLLNDGWPYQVS